jgi:glucosylceramidase
MVRETDPRQSGRPALNKDADGQDAVIRGWITRDVHSVLQPIDAVPFADLPQQNTHPTIAVACDETFQPIEGFGFALTGGSASLLAGLAADARAALLLELFGTTGDSIGLSCVRLSIGASDMGRVSFSYCDLPPGTVDPMLAGFDLAAGDPEVVPILREILLINPDLKIIASPWSAPPWMKTNGSFVAGVLKPEYYAAYTDYFVKYIEAMRRHGIHVGAVTPQNEPHNPKNEPSMVMSATEQAEFIKGYLGPALQQAAPEVEILCWDHNCDEPDYPLTVLGDPAAREYISGVAWHLYMGTAEAMSQVRLQYPEQKMYFTEQWIFAGDDFAGALRWHIKNIVIGTLRNWSRTVLEWNLASDPKCELHTPGGAQGSLGGVTIGPEVIRNAGYYLMGHTAKFIPPGSVRIQSNEPEQLPNVACMTPDRRIVMVVLNDGAGVKIFNVTYQDSWATLVLDAGAVGTFCWPVTTAVF